MKAKNYFIITFMLLGLCGAVQVFCAENPHEISGQGGAVDCVSCHTEKPQNAKASMLETKNHRADVAAFKSDGVEMCSGCHDANDGHKVGLKLDFEVPADMPLSRKNELTCLTCHYTHGSLSSNRPQASVSFMDSLLDAERLHKSFLLRRNNADGELCLTCHEVKEGSSNVK
jgi:formate-dependent nitrite reductase cytochrome c552 subunit